MSVCNLGASGIYLTQFGQMFRPSLKIFPVFRALNEVIGNMETSAALTLLKSGSYKLNLNVLTILTT